jgi:transmembrane sensor
MNTMEQKIRSAAVEQAAEWFIANRSGDLTPREREDFRTWLCAAPANVREYLAIVSMSGDLQAARPSDAEVQAFLQRALAGDGNSGRDNVVPLRESAKAPQPQCLAQKPRQLVGRRFALAAAILIVGGGTVWGLYTGLLNPNRSFDTAHGEQRVVQLRDGSVMHLNSDSRVSVRYTKAERRIDVGRGQVLFDVVHEALRPFRVRAGTTEVLAIGTQFDVYRQARGTVVTVIEGQVQVYRAAWEPDTGADTDRTSLSPSRVSRIGVAAGRQVRVSSGEAAAASAALPQPIAVDVKKAMAWLQRQIIFEQQRLDEVVSEFNRYGRIPIILQDERLRGVRVSGQFNAYDTDSFIELLRRLDGVEVNVNEREIAVRAHR